MPSFEAADFVVARGALIFLATGLLLAWVSLARGWPKLDAAQHWTERARLVFPINQAVLGFAVVWQWVGVITFVIVAQPNPRWVQAFAAIGICRLTYPLVMRLVERRQLGRMTPLRPVFTWAVTEATVAACVVALPGAWRLLGLGAAVVLVLASALGLTARGVVGRWFGFRPLPAETERVLRAAVPAPELIHNFVVMESAWGQGLMTWRTMILTSRALELLDENELKAVAAHEAGHRVSWRGPALALRIAIAFAPWLAFLLLATLLPVIALALVLSLGLFVARSTSSELLRQDEDHADDHANAVDLANALQRLQEANLMPAVLATRTTHRNLVERLRRLGREPEWPVPAAPGRTPTTLAQAALIVACFCISYSYTRPQSDVAGVLRPVFNLPMPADPPPQAESVVYRHLANGDCTSASRALTEDAPASLRRVVASCGERWTDCRRIFETPIDELAEHVRVAREGDGLALVYDPRFTLAQGQPTPGGDTNDAPTPLELRPGSRFVSTGANELGIGWKREREGSLPGVIPWNGLFELRANGRCWRR